MITNNRPAWVAGALFVILWLADAASAQDPPGTPVYGRVTITNQTDIAVVFRARWPNEEPRRHILNAGESTTLETTFAAGTPKPELRVVYQTGSWRRRPEVFSLPSGHVDPRTDNPGRVYDFYRQESNVGPIVTLTAR